jgi:HAD superfamily hydrolase (TIGR01509 family)
VERLPRFEAIVFDMDGVLLDSEPLHYAALRSVLGAEGVTYSSTENEEFIGSTVEHLFSTLMRRYTLRRSMPEYIDLYDAAVLNVLATPRAPAAGVQELLTAADKLGVRLALASSSRRAWIDATLRAIGLPTTFEVIVSGDDVTRGKPDPEIYLQAAARLGLKADRCLAIEDAPNGVLSARRAGMPVIGVRTPYTSHLELEGTLVTVDSLSDLDPRQLLLPA